MAGRNVTNPRQFPARVRLILIFIRMTNRVILAKARNKKAQYNEVLSFRYPKGFLRNKIGHRPTLPPVTAVPLALAGLTSLFGMGRGGHRRYRHLKIFAGWLVG